VKKALRVFLLPRESDSCFSEDSRRNQGKLHKQAYEPQFWSIRQTESDSSPIRHGKRNGRGSWSS